MVNRIWQWHFGEGIVRTPDNFGKMGERPTHPELLDYLASEFIESGWSIKAMHRTIMLVERLPDEQPDAAEASQKDPENRLFSRFHRRRLDVEEIRDGLLAIDGSLDFDHGRHAAERLRHRQREQRRPAEPEPGESKRRTVYLPLRRSNLPTLLNLFDFGDATTTTGKRAADQRRAAGAVHDEQRVRPSGARRTRPSAILEPTARRRRSAWSAPICDVLNRKPAPEEIDAAVTYIANFPEKFAQRRADAWQSFCRALMASNDFIYVD